ncbi:MAG: hypothetical protein LBK22_02685 [Tannerella sp.]|jgi:hypothetical protein|nr:hypothetical protein [Tannerella sp.]
MKTGINVTVLVLALALTGFKTEDVQLKGWIILSGNMENAAATIRAAGDYGINHLQLSHHIVHNLFEVKEEPARNRVNRLAQLAHREGIREVLVWDHSFYDLAYYPDPFKTGPEGTLDLDNPAFWEWYKQDYREMLDLVPDVDGLVLTFIETGAHAERQHSVRMKTGEEKLAAVVNAVAAIVIRERKKKLYIRTFAYSEEEYANITGCLNHVESDEIVLMMKETPHDFFLTHPNDPFIGKINRPTIVEFDAGNEYNGQGVIANTWPGYVMKRWKDFMKHPNVTGYVARTDRYGTAKSVGTANEILLYALKRTAENPAITPEQVYDGFITARYGKEALEPVKSAFKKAYGIVLSSLYILGTNAACHSSINYEPYNCIYDRHVSGRWLDPPVVFVGHGINREFHYWKDVVNHIAPARFKTKDAPLAIEVKYVIDRQWVEPAEAMDSTFLHYILTEKQYGTRLAAKALSEIEQARDFLKPPDYEELQQLFYRTSLTAQLYEAVCTAYFGFRIYARGPSYRYSGLEEQIRSALNRIDTLTDEMKRLEGTYPVGQWDWLKDTGTAQSYKQKILNGWPEYGHAKLPSE